MTERATLVDVAAAAGVSKSTVSRVVNGDDRVADETRATVKSAIAELGYRPNAHATRLRRGRTNVVAVVVPRLDRWYFSAVVTGLQQRLAEHGIDLLVHGAYSSDDRRAFTSQILEEKDRFDGVVLASVPLADTEAEQMHEAGAAVVTIGQRTEWVTSVSIDDWGAAVAGTQHLINLGHRRIATISIDSASDRDLAAARTRRDAFTETLANNGVDLDPELLVAESSSLDGGQQAMSRLLSVRNRPTAVFAFSDELAFGALLAARSLGVDIPLQLSVLGFDDHTMAEAFKLTTIHQPVADLGRRAADEVLAQIEDKAAPVRHLAEPFKLVVRQTTANNPEMAT